MKKLLAATVQIHNQDKEEMAVKFVFLRSNKKNDDWVALLTTNIELDEEEISRIYAKRWNIEVLFKIFKPDFAHLYMDSVIRNCP